MYQAGSGEHRGSRRFGGWSASIAALLIVAAQLLALAHSHPALGPSRSVSRAQIVSSDICGLCLLAYHAPLGLASPSAPGEPRVAVAATPGPATRFSFASSHTHFLTRAPPLAV